MRLLFSALVVASTVACSPSERGLGYSDPVQMAVLKARMQEEGIPFRESEDRVIFYEPQYRSQVDAIVAALNQPYVDGVFEDEEYGQMYLAQLKAMNRFYYVHAVAGKQAVRWWKKQPDDLQILNERVAIVWRAAHPATGNPCDSSAMPSNSAAHPDARASAVLNQPPSPARAGGCER
jgi:hypothetical protein